MANPLSSLLVAFIVLLPATSFAQPVLPNPDFDDNLQGWDSTAGKSWSEDDADGATNSGSLQIEISDIASTAISACVPADAGRVYDFGVAVKLDIPQNTAGRAGAVLRFTSDAECTVDLEDFPPNAFRTFALDWDDATGTAIAPLGTVAVRFELRATKTGGSGAAIVANLDDASLFLAEVCGDLSPPFGEYTTADALYVLRAAVGAVAGDPCVADVNSSGTVAAIDALTVLRASVGITTLLDCPPCF